MKTKICTKCKQKKLIAEFGKDKNRKDGSHPQCKQCVRQYQNANCSCEKWKKTREQYRQKNKEKIRQSKKEHYQDNREKILQQQKECYQKSKNILIFCDYCGKETKKTSRQIIKSKHHFCNRICQNRYLGEKDKKKRISVYCAYCNRLLKRLPSRVRRCNYFFCNIVCQGCYYSIYPTKPTMTESEKERWQDALAAGRKCPSNLELTISSIIKEYKLSFKFTGFGRKGERIGGKKPDYTHSFKNKLIEVYSIYNKNVMYIGGAKKYQRDRFFHFGKYRYNILFITLENDIKRKEYKKWCYLKIKDFDLYQDFSKTEWLSKLIFNHNHLWYCLTDLINYIKTFLR